MHMLKCGRITHVRLYIGSTVYVVFPRNNGRETNTSITAGSAGRIS